ncbi:unnamed protein product [Trifolium pratense]|uniref:Uncharacterized protein n=1 Tax=Trifolium pratense TaxID=57577 RepID=A0ACB0K6E9_TRIPR|nr:unnamed protein product [Trifolium pratense]
MTVAASPVGSTSNFHTSWTIACAFLSEANFDVSAVSGFIILVRQRLTLMTILFLSCRSCSEMSILEPYTLGFSLVLMLELVARLNRSAERSWTEPWWCS